MKKKKINAVFYIILTVLAIAYLFPILLVVMNSFKGRLYINSTPFILPSTESFVGFNNYIVGLEKVHFWESMVYSFLISIGSIVLIIVFCSMAGWCLMRLETKWATAIYYVFVTSMVVPFQMIMYTLTKTADLMHLNNLIGICIIYLGIGSGQSVFICAGFVKTVPVALEEAAMIDGCNPVQIYFRIVFPILKPILITIAILNAMWIWNDYLLPYLIIGNKFQTIPIAVQNLRSAYGSIDYGHLMAVIVIALIPVSIFYFACQKYIIEGIVSGAVKG